MKAFWNNGSPREVREGALDNASGRFIGRNPDPSIDLYDFVPGAKPTEGETLVSTSYDNDGWAITQTHVYTNVSAGTARTLMKSKVAQKYEQVIGGGIVFSVSSLELSSSDRQLGLLLGMINRAANGTDIEAAVKFTTLDGVKVSAGASAATRLVNYNKYADEISEHWAACGMVRDIHLAAIDALSDTPVSAILSYDFTATSDYAASDASYALAQGWPINPTVGA